MIPSYFRPLLTQLPPWSYIALSHHVFDEKFLGSGGDRASEYGQLTIAAYCEAISMFAFPCLSPATQVTERINLLHAKQKWSQIFPNHVHSSVLKNNFFPIT